MDFAWHPEKAASKLQKYQVSFAEASTIFCNPLSTVFPDPRTTYDEDRFVMIGMSSQGRLLIVAHTDRDGRTRIMSARLATRRERTFYEDG